MSHDATAEGPTPKGPATKDTIPISHPSCGNIGFDGAGESGWSVHPTKKGLAIYLHKSSQFQPWNNSKCKKRRHQCLESGLHLAVKSIESVNFCIFIK